MDTNRREITKRGQLEKKPSKAFSRQVWKQYTFILDEHTLRYINDQTREVKELRCADITAIDYSTRAKDAKFPITIHTNSSEGRNLQLRAQSKEDHDSWVEAFRHIQDWIVSPPGIFIQSPRTAIYEPMLLPCTVPQNASSSPSLQNRPSVHLSSRPPVPLPDTPTYCSITSLPYQTISPDYDVSSSALHVPDIPATNVSSQVIAVADSISPSIANNTPNLAEQIYGKFTKDQIQGLMELLSKLYDHQFKKEHVYINLEMLLEAVSLQTTDTNYLCIEDDQTQRPDWTKAKTDEFDASSLAVYDTVAYISPISITGREKIGQGQFGDVYKATLQGQSEPIEVALKTYKNIQNCTDEQNFMKEIGRLSQLVHPNIVLMYGVVMEGGFPAMVMEYLPHSDLKTFLMKNTRGTDKLVKYMIDVAMAMSYISEKGLVHRDLAARNILVDDKELCKVGDFGLLRELPAGCDIYVSSSSDPLPCRWMALESLADGHFSVASDVWSYGILMWEMFKPSKVPYEELGPFQIVSKLKDGYRLPLPRGIPRVLGDVMKACWNKDPSKRPSFLLICTKLTMRGLMLKEEDYTYGTFSITK